MITIVDYGVGNIASIVNMLKRVGATAVLASTPEEIARANKLILPGVGSFDGGMQHLIDRGLIPALTAKALEEKIPVLGLCLGMQLLGHGSEEGKLPGLGWIEGSCIRFRQPPGEQLRIPHMGWNRVRIVRNHDLVSELGDDARFYFVHAYHLSGTRPEVTVAEATYGAPFPAIIAQDNIMGCQFHPEKSHRFGMTLMRAFATMPEVARA